MLPAPPRHPKRLVYVGTPDIAVPPLRAVHAAGHDIALVISRPDSRRSRRGHDVASPVKAAATELGLAVSDRIDDALETGADLGVVAAYGRIIPRRVLEVLPMVNIHYSLLPRWRGAAPVERAILAGDARTGVCLMAVEEGLDTGGVYDRVVLDIGEHETADELRARLVDASVEQLLRTLSDGLGEPEPQKGEPTYAEKIEPADLEVEWTAPAVQVERLVRVGGAWTTFRAQRLKIRQALAHDDGADLEPGQLDGTRVGTGAGVVELIEVQPEGKPPRAASEWLHGVRPDPTDRLGR